MNYLEAECGVAQGARHLLWVLPPGTQPGSHSADCREVLWWFMKGESKSDHFEIHPEHFFFFSELCPEKKLLY